MNRKSRDQWNLEEEEEDEEGGDEVEDDEEDDDDLSHQTRPRLHHNPYSRRNKGDEYLGMAQPQGIREDGVYDEETGSYVFQGKYYCSIRGTLCNLEDKNP